MIYTNVDLKEDKNYSISFNDNFYEVFTPYYEKDSYYNVLYRLFGLLPQDFYHYVGAVFHAHFRPSPNLNFNIYMRFKNKQDAINFASEIDRRLTYLIEREDSK